MIFLTNWDLYNFKLNINGVTQRDRDIAIAKRDFRQGAINSPAYVPNATRNGNSQEFLFLSAKAPNQYEIISFPDEDLSLGDYITTSQGTWIVTQVNSYNVIQKKGLIWLCDYKLKFQNSTSDIIERWSVLDFNLTSAVEGDKQISYLEKSAKIYLPYDDSTKKIYEDKRLATGKKFDSNGNEILEAYSVTGIHDLSNKYGEGGHLLALDCKSCNYSPTNDNLELQICDYISPAITPPVGTLLPCSISGRSTILTGATKSYKVTFYQSDGVTVVDNVEAVWSITPSIDGITMAPNSSLINISIADNDNLIGASFTISVTDKNGLYNIAIFNVEVADV